MLSDWSAGSEDWLCDDHVHLRNDDEAATLPHEALAIRSGKPENGFLDQGHALLPDDLADCQGDVELDDQITEVTEISAHTPV